MTRREKLQDAYEDALFALLMEDMIEEEGKRLLEENERLKRDPSAAVPDELRERCMKTIHRAYGQRRRREAGKRAGRVAYRAFSRVAVVMVICMVLFTAAFAASPDLRVKTLNLLIEISDVKIILSTNDGNGSLPGYDTSAAAQAVYDQFGYRIPVMPEGFELTEKLIVNTTANLIYQGSNGASIRFSLAQSTGGKYTVDTENAQRVESITINGFNALLIAKDSWIRIVWNDLDQDIFLSITGTALDEAVLLDIANAMTDPVK